MFDILRFFQTSHESNSIVWVVLFVEAIYAFGCLLIISELCQRLTNGFGEVNEMINEIDWISFPTEIQGLLPMFIAISQLAIDFKVFGSITNSRETFKQVRFVQFICSLKQSSLIIAVIKF